MQLPRLFHGISELVQPHREEGSGREPVTVTPAAALLVDANGRVVAAGREDEVRSDPRSQGAMVIDLGGRAMVPGFVDSHTHTVFAGDRIDEMARRCRGETYEQIARAGGGIARSARLLAAASQDEIVAQSAPRLAAMLARGTTTCEIKSGYGLLPEHELKQLEAIDALARTAAPTIMATALAHVVPPSHRERRAGYVDLFCDEVLTPAARAGLAAYCDVFVENGAFTPEEARRIGAHARQLGLGLKLHVDQLHEGGGAELAAELGAISADHLEHVSEAGMRALARAGVVATLLPGCGLFLGRGPWPDGRGLRESGCQVAVATDCNPGSSMIVDLTLCATMAATRCGLTLEEALWAITRGGARALGREDRGCLRPGERADFVVVDHHDWRALLYSPGAAPLYDVAVAGMPTKHPPVSSPGR